MSLIETVDLCQRYGERDILKNVNIRVDRGEVFALIGPTGAGKTTLLRLIDLIDVPTSGRIYFDGVDTAASAGVRLEMRRRMAFVLQKPIVFNMSVYDNIAYGLKWRGVGKSHIRQKVGSNLETVELSADKSRNARTLSGGEVQKNLPLEPTRGAIKNIQNQSRLLTEGKYTISKATALQVLKGKISLMDAIEKEKI